MPAGHDLNALLIGALYGELSAVEESRLQAHLAAHPGDHELLRQLTRTREVIRSSAALAVVDPPQAISALLLQEAARRAPRQRSPERGAAFGGGRLQRWAAALIAHPGLAAATMAVLVVGVFGTMVLRGKHRLADSTVSAPAAEQGPAGGAGAGPAEGTDSTVMQANAAVTQAGRGNSSPGEPPLAEPYSVDLDSPRAGSEVADERSFGDRAQLAGKGDAVAAGTPSSAPPSDAPPSKYRAKAASRGYVEAQTRDLALKDFDERDDGKLEQAPTGTVAPLRTAAPKSAREVTAGAENARDKRSRDEVDRVEASPEPEEDAAAAPMAPSPPPSPPPASSGASTVATASDGKPLYDDAWAKSEHVRLVRLARSSKCSEAAAVAGTLAVRAARYYQDHVAGDRELRVCAAAIRDQLNLQSAQAKRKRAPAAVDRVNEVERK